MSIRVHPHRRGLRRQFSVNSAGGLSTCGRIGRPGRAVARPVTRLHCSTPPSHGSSFMALHLALARVHGSSMRGDWFCARTFVPDYSGSRSGGANKEGQNSALKGRVLPISEDGAPAPRQRMLMSFFRRYGARRQSDVGPSSCS